MFVYIYRKRGKASATVHSTNLVVLETSSGIRSSLVETGDQGAEMGNKSSTPNKKENGE